MMWLYSDLLRELMIFRALVMVVSVNMLLLTSYILIFVSMGLEVYISTVLALLTILTSNILSRFNVSIGNVRLDDEFRKASMVRIGSKYLVQLVRFKTMNNISLEFNLGGFLIPLTLSTSILTYIASSQGASALITTSLLVIISALLINRVSVVVRGVGLAVPIVMVSLMVSLATMLVVTILGSPHQLWLLSYVASYISVLVGVDIMNLGKVVVHNVRRVIVGGLNIYDALSVIPASTTLITYTVLKLLQM
jgi:uncharacterized membrane protein